MPKKEISAKNIAALLRDIKKIISTARYNSFRALNREMLKAYFEIGRKIVEEEQSGKERAEYGKKLLDKLSNDLKIRYGKGFSKSNIYLMRLFYLKYSKFQTVSGKLSWSHYSKLYLPTKEELEKEIERLL